MAARGNRRGFLALLRAIAVFVSLVFSVCVHDAVAAPPLAPSASGAPSASPEPGSQDVLDRKTPRRTLEGFLKEGREGDFRVAANYLDLRGIPQARRDRVGPDLAEKLAYALERMPTLDLERVPDTPDGSPVAKLPGTVVADTLYAGEQPIPIAFTLLHFPDGVDRWLIARATVDGIPAIDATYGLRTIGVHIPAALTQPTILGNEPWQWIGAALALVFAYGIARLIAALAVWTASYFARRTATQVDDAFVEAARRPLRIILAALAFRLLLSPLQLTTELLAALEHVTYTALVAGGAWLILRALGVATIWLDEHTAHDGSDALRGRRVRTQATILRRVAGMVIGFFSVALILMQFEFVRNVGVSLLASAGIAGIVVGLAAQKSLAAIIGGVQFSFAQPVRLGDQVVIEGEFGEIEEIHLTFAVVKLWDKRRLVLPVTYFLEKPFQNWTRSYTDIVGSVLIKADFAIGVDDVRRELHRICESDPLWDKTTCSLQVTDSDSASVTLRALVSAKDASSLWDLRCNVRERLLGFVHSQENGKYLVRNRHTVETSPTTGS